ncbi:MAG TPA: hypothetical protein VGG98_06740 [Solirubrobacteraceae bacterium]|jgi:hypothetical protein
MATSAASASASQPEFKGGFPTKYTLPNHTITYESGIAIVTCNGGGSTTGSITGAKTGTLNTMTFTSCGSFCNQFKTAELESIPVYTNKATKAVSLLLKPKTGTTFATTECGLEKGEIRGSILVPITPTNTLTKEFTLKARGTHGEQVPQEYENEKGEKVKVTLEGRLFGAESFVKCGLSFTVGITTEKYLELQAL